MNIREYIESGILEAYVLGSLTPVEHDDVAANIARFPELAAEVATIEATMFDFAVSQAKEPPPGLDSKIWDAVNTSATVNNSSSARENTGTTVPNKTMPFQPVYSKRPQMWKYAAVWAGLVGSIALNFILWKQGNETRKDQLVLSTSVKIMQEEQHKLASALVEYRKAGAMMADTAMQTIVMHTMQKGHPMAATLYWSKDKGDAYVAMNELPAPPEGMQYQLWVIQEGKPVSMGMLPNAMANTPAMQKLDMKVTSGQAFAISLEKAGGNPTPTTVYVLGKA